MTVAVGAMLLALFSLCISVIWFAYIYNKATFTGRLSSG